MSGTQSPALSSYLYAKYPALHPVDRIHGGNLLGWIVMGMITRMIEPADRNIRRLEERNEAVHILRKA